MTRGAIHLALAVVLGCTTAWAAVALATSWRDQQMADDPARALPDPGTRVQKAIDDLRDTGVHVAPDGRRMVDAAGERKIEAAVAQSDAPVHVIVWAPSTQDGDWLRVDDQLKREFAGEKALILVWEGPEEGQVIEVGGSPDYYSAPRGDQALTYTSDFVGDATTRLVEGVRATDGAPWEPEDTGESRASLISAGIVIGGLMALGVIAVAWALMFVVRTRTGGRVRLPGGWKWTGGPRRG